jgi:hypothetical protein
MDGGYERDGTGLGDLANSDDCSRFTYLSVAGSNTSFRQILIIWVDKRENGASVY